MQFENIHIRFVFESGLSAKTIRDAVASCLEFGCETQLESDGQFCWYLGPATDFSVQEVALDDAISDMASQKKGSLTLFYGELDISIGATQSHNGLVDMNTIIISVDPTHVRENIWGSATETSNNIRHLLSIVIELYEQLAPAHVWGGENRDTYRDDETSKQTVSRERISKGQIGRIHWLNIFSPKTVGYLGRSRILSIPAWHIEELSDGGMLVALTPNPLQRGEIEQTAEEVAVELGISTES